MFVVAIVVNNKKQEVIILDAKLGIHTDANEECEGKSHSIKNYKHYLLHFLKKKLKVSSLILKQGTYSSKHILHTTSNFGKMIKKKKPGVHPYKDSRSWKNYDFNFSHILKCYVIPVFGINFKFLRFLNL